MTQEERGSSKYLVYQLLPSRYGMNPDDLRKADAIEVVVGGWHFDGWMLKILGYHDAYASGVIHAIAGGFALGVLVVLGPRIGKFSSSGEPRNIGPRNPWLIMVN